jgi:hypothetical protein
LKGLLMTAPRFKHKRITGDEFRQELARQNIDPRTFTRLWCQNWLTVHRWLRGEKDIPTWVPIALTTMTLPNARETLRVAAAAMIEQDTARPDLGAFPYKALRDVPADFEQGE